MWNTGQTKIIYQITLDCKSDMLIDAPMLIRVSSHEGSGLGHLGFINPTFGLKIGPWQVWRSVSQIISIFRVEPLRSCRK